MKKIRLLSALDCSGSMGRTKRYIAKENYMQIAKLLSQYDEPLPKFFVQFTTSALSKGCNYTNSPEAFFEESLTGGTYLSSGIEPILEEVKNTPDDLHNVIIIYSDGDNWTEDNPRVIECFAELSKKNTTIIFTRIALSTYISTIESCIMDNKDKFIKPVTIQRLYQYGELFKDIEEILIKDIEGAL